ncbi:MAG: hypothetical protein KJ069_28690 [Anaerolineae bacterium]|nr:hypothetical protein [Anaerolineae bacterium]
MFSVDRTNLPSGLIIDDSQPYLLFITNTTTANLYLLNLEQWNSYAVNKQAVLDSVLFIPPGEDINAIEVGPRRDYWRSLSSPTTEPPQLYFVINGEPLSLSYTISEVPDPYYDPVAAQTAVAQSQKDCRAFWENESSSVEVAALTSGSPQESGTAVTFRWLLLIASLVAVGLLVGTAVVLQKRKS